jgi:hypothetical protein
MWKMGENGFGNLFAGEYGGAWSDTCAFIHVSDDGGHTWSIAYECCSRHVHFVSVDPNTDRVYASIGDGPGRYRLIASDDGGQVWNVLYAEDCLAQPISVAFTPDSRVFGSDCGVMSNMIYATSDDETFDARLLLSGERDSYVWDMSVNADGYIYAGTKAKLASGSDVWMYASYDGGENWCGVRSFGVLPEWNGVTDISNFDSEGWAYCTYSTSCGSYSAMRFRHESASCVHDSPAGSHVAPTLHVDRCPTRFACLFRVHVPEPSRQCKLRVYDIRGALVCRVLEERLVAGIHEVAWDGTNEAGQRVSSGVYFVKLYADNVAAERKLVMLH